MRKRLIGSAVVLLLVVVALHSTAPARYAVGAASPLRGTLTNGTNTSGEGYTTLTFTVAATITQMVATPGAYPANGNLFCADTNFVSDYDGLAGGSYDTGMLTGNIAASCVGVFSVTVNTTYGAPPLASLVVYGTGGNPAPTATPTPVPTATPIPIATRVPTGTPTPAPKTANDAIRPWSAGYMVGNNYGYQAGWSNAQYGDLSVAVRQQTTRYSLPLDYLTTYGLDAERANLDHMKAIGMHDLVCFLSPRVDGTYPIPTDLDQPIWSSPGVINPGNSWAVYVDKTVREYGDMITTWEVWNEPDFNTNYTLGAVGGAWSTRPPQASETPNWQSTMQEYVRILRISYEVVHARQPNGYVSTGGITNEPYLDWILRLTDNPVDGSVTPQYPLKGGAYFDVLSFHEYPIYAEQDWQAQQKDVFLPTGTTQYDLANWTQKVKNLKYIAAKNGYDGSKYPAKIILTTETGVPWQVTNDPSSGLPVDPATESKRAADTASGQIGLMRQLGVVQLYFYQLNDRTAPGTGLTDGFNHMSIYQYLTTPDKVQTLSPIGVAIKDKSP